MSPARIHFAVLTYNALELTRRCFASIAAHTPLPFAVTVLDNASRDGTQAFLRGLGDQRFRVFESAVNLGVPAGRNVLLDAVLPDLPEDGFVVFLDNDIELQAGWCDPFLRLFGREPRAGIASADGWAIEVRGDVRVPLVRPQRTGRVDICAGGYACWVRKAAARAVGGFDEALGLFWHEDDDYCVRMAQAGFQVFAVPEAPMVHRAHASGVGTSLEDPRSLRNQAYLAAKWRAHAFVDDGGFVVAGDAPFYLPPERRAEFAARLGRRLPICRSEWAQAVWDRQEFARCRREGAPFHRPASPLLLALLDDEGIDAAALRGSAGTMAKAHAPAGVSRACRTGDYDDPGWLAEHRVRFGPGAGPDWFQRNRHEWTVTRLLSGLRALGVLRQGGTGVNLSLPDTSVPAALRDGLALHGVSVVQDPATAGFAFALAGPLVSGSEPRFATVLDAARSGLRHGSVLALAVDVALDPEVAPTSEAIRTALRAYGFEPCGATDLRSDVAAPDVPPPGAEGPWPLLASGSGAEGHTSAVLFARKGVLPSPAPQLRAPVDWHCTVDLSGLGSTTALPPWQRYAVDLLAAVATAQPGVHFTLHLQRDPPPALWPVLQQANVRCGMDPGQPSDLAFLLVPGPRPAPHGRCCALLAPGIRVGPPRALCLRPGPGDGTVVGLGIPAATARGTAGRLLAACGVTGRHAALLFAAEDLSRVVPVLQAFAAAGEQHHLFLIGEAAPLLQQPLRALSCGQRVHAFSSLDPASEAALLRSAAAAVCLADADPRLCLLATAGVPVFAPASPFAQAVLGALRRPWSARGLQELLDRGSARTPVPAPSWGDVAAQVLAAWRRKWPELTGSKPSFAPVGGR